MVRIDCQLITGHWIAITLSILLFNIGIALASFATTFGSRGWRIVGATTLGIGFIMFITIPLLIRRSIRSRFREAFRSLTEAELRRKRCSGHYIAWVLSAINFILGIALTSYSMDIQSGGWSIVGMGLIVVGFFIMILTSVFIYRNLRETNPQLKEKQTKDEQNLLSSSDPSKGPMLEPNGVDTSLNTPSAPTIEDCSSVLEARHGSTGSTILDLTTDQIDQISHILDKTDPNWNLLANRIASSNMHEIKNYNDFLHDIDECRKCNFVEDNTTNRLFTYLQIKEPKIYVRTLAEYAELRQRIDIVDFINTTNIRKTHGGDERPLCDVDSSDREILVRLLANYIEDDWSVIADIFNITHKDISDILQPTHSSPTGAFFDLLKVNLPQLTINELSTTLKDIGRTDVAVYLEQIFLSS